jgi:two-component system NtrC family sensor kinase
MAARLLVPVGSILDTPHIRWRNRLGVKLAAAITLVSVATLSILFVVMVRSQRRHLLAQSLASASFVSDTINRSIQHDMLHDRREDAYQILDEIARQEHIERLRIFDGSGRIRYSTASGEIGRVASLQDESCQPCHRSGRAPTLLPLDSHTRIVERNGRLLLGAVTPIYNQPSCSSASCHVHPAERRVLGEIELGLALEAVDRESGVLERSSITLSLLAILALGSLAYFFARRLVGRPLAHLLDGINRVSEGDLDHQIPVGRGDELGALQASFNTMGSTLAETRAERNALLEGLERQVLERTAALERSQAHLVRSEKLSSLGRLSASIAHEINNPLAGILTTSKLLIRNIEDDPKGPRQAATLRLLKLVERETERCSAIVRNLLGFARERPLTLTDTDVNAALEEALFLAANQLALQNVTVERHLGPLPAVSADFGQLRQAFANVVINAADAMPQGGTLRVRSRHASEDREVCVEIADSGVGIPKDQLARVFEPFFTSKNKGTGLGLSVVYGIVQRHGGRITMDSTVGAGTTVTFWLSTERSPQPPDGRVEADAVV